MIILSSVGMDLHQKTEQLVEYNSIEVPNISLEDFFDAAFKPIARDGAGNIEVMLRLQKAYSSIATIDNSEIKEIAKRHSKTSYERAEKAIIFEQELDILLKQGLLKNK